jgi:hypothetical protein
MKTVLMTVVAVAVVAVIGLSAVPVAKAEDAKVATVAAYDTHTITVTMTAGRHIIGVKGDGDTTLRIRVYNDTGELIARGTNNGGISTVTILAPRSGTVQVEVTNMGPFANQYVIAVTE